MSDNVMIVEPRTSWNKSLTRHDNGAIEDADSPFGFLVPRVPAEIRETIKPGYGDGTDVWFECEVVQPKSTLTRTVYVHIPPEQVLALLKMCRHAAAAQREKPMATEVCAPPFGDVMP